MSLFQTGFKVDASVPVASTSTTAHPAAGSAHKKRKRDSNAATAAGDLLSTPNNKNHNVTGSAKSTHKTADQAANKTEEIDIFRILEGPSTDVNQSTTSSSKTAEAVVNIEKLMKKLERMEKGDKNAAKAGSTSTASPANNKKQKVGESNGGSASASVQNPHNKGKNVTKTANGSETSVPLMNQNGISESKTSKSKKNNKKKKDIGDNAPKSDYVPDEAALAKREARKLKKEAQSATKKPSSAAEDQGTAQEAPSAADKSAMHIDLIEATVSDQQPILEVPLEAKTTKKSKGKKVADIGNESIVEQAEQQQTASTPVKSSDTLPSAKKPKPQQSQGAPPPVGALTKEADVGMTDLQKKMQKKLGGARFRWINEQLYTTTGMDALQLMEEDPAMFEDYHNGFASQAASWPVQPIQVFIDYFRSTYTSSTSSPKPIIADLGCGKAELAATLVPSGFTVLSYDLVESEPYIVRAQCTKRLPLPGSSDTTKEDSPGSVVDFVVCCLSLMGNDWLGMVSEARRVLKAGGKLKIAEVTSRFEDVKAFVNLIAAVGFKLLKKDESNTHFILFDFEKIPISACKSPFLNLSADAKSSKSQELLKPCIYKRR